MLRTFCIQYLMLFIGTWYKWGGSDPSGFDCSGLVIEGLKAVGKLPRQYENTASGLYEHFKSFETDNPKPGCLVFYTNDNGKIVHVELLVNDILSIGASGGGRFVRSTEDAMNFNAFVKIRPYKSRNNIFKLVDPFMNDV